MTSSMNFIFIASTIDRDLGGIARSVPALAAGVAVGNRVRLLAPRAREDTLSTIDGLKEVDLHYADGFKGVEEELVRLLDSAPTDTVLYHAGVWNSLNHFVAQEACDRGIPYIVSTRSMLDPWALNHRRWKKRLAWWTYAKNDLLNATAIHATAELEAGFIRKALGPACPRILVVPNGVKVTGEASASGNSKQILFLSRLHPKKGILDLIRAYGKLDIPGWNLFLAGNDDGRHRRACENCAAQQPNHDRIRIRGAVTDTDKWDLYRSAGLFVLPSYSENFGIVVGEALASGVPVLTTTKTPWSEYARRGGLNPEDLGIWITEPGMEPLHEKLGEVLAIPEEERMARAAKGSRWIREEFDWASIGRKFAGAVQDVLNPQQQTPPVADR